jgi:site-specific recombinase XerD
MPQAKSYTNQYHDYLTQIGKSPHTVRAYSNDIRHFINWFRQTNGRDFNLQAVDPRDSHDYRSYLLQNGRRPATINRRLKALKSIFRWANREKLVTDSPFEIIETIFVEEQKNTAPHWLDRREQLALLRTVREGGSKRDLAIIQTLLGAGLRISELAALKISNLDISERKGSLRVIGKRGKFREIPMDNNTRQALENYLKERQEDGSESIFLGQRGPISAPGINYLIAKYVYQARIENCTAHTLRHTFARNLIDTDTPLDQVATLLGHESLDTTKIYTRPSQQDLERAVRRAAGELSDYEEIIKS